MRKGILYTLGLTKETFTSNKASIVAIFLLSLITVTPLLNNGKYLVILWTIFIFLTIRYFQKADITLCKILILGTTYAFICILYWYMGISSAQLAYCMTRPFLYFAPVSALIIISNNNDNNQIRFLFQCISLAIAINIADSIWITHVYGIEDLVYQNLKEQEGLEGLNLGGSLFVNMIVFYANIMLLAFLHTKTKIEKKLYFLYFILSAYFIVICSLKASAIIFLFFSTFLQYIAYKGGNNFGSIIVLLIIFLGLLMFFRDVIISFLINIINSDRISSRLEVFAYGASVMDNESFSGRESLFLTSLNTWLNNPLSFFFGIGDHNWAEFASNADSGIGNHSDLIDIFARYGLIGGTIFYATLALFYKYVQERYGSIFKWEIISFFTIIIIMGFSKHIIDSQPAIIIFLLFPLCLRYLSGTIKKNIS